jgi:2'-5' RNA ligase
MRLFIAVDLPEDIKKKITSIINEIKAKDTDVKFVELENLHITLKFLGEVGDEKKEEINNILSSVAAKFNTFEVETDGLGYFGTPNFIKVLWLGLSSGKEKLIELIKELDNKLNYIRPNEYQPSPHITLGRVQSGKNREVLLKVIEKYRNTEMGKFTAEKIVLKQSTLTRDGPVYTDLNTFPLR